LKAGFGAPDIGNFVWSDCFIDRRDLATYDDLSRFIYALTPGEFERYREAGREYLASPRITASPRTPSRTASLMVGAQLRERGMAGGWD
jgi:hypothetical protein